MPDRLQSTYRRMQVDLAAVDNRHLKLLLVLVAALNSPPLLAYLLSRIPFLRLPSYLALLLWINVPARLSATLGIHTYRSEGYGALPSGFVEWGLIGAFWTIIALVLTMNIRIIQHNRRGPR